MSRGLRMLTVHSARQTAPDTKTILFKEKFLSKPGQFVMVWVPGIDEMPMSVSYTLPRLGITFKVVGEGTRALASRKPGDRLGVRGPFGNGFSMTGSRILGVAGGTGMASLAPLLEVATTKGVSVELVMGAKTSKELLFEERMTDVGIKVHVSTDDGSKGFKGLATDLARQVMSERRFDCVYACGPEKMIVGLLPLASEHGAPMQASLERHMKCGIGICDSCAIDGRRVCKDGPVFSRDDLEHFDDLGRTKLDSCGRKVPV